MISGIKKGNIPICNSFIRPTSISAIYFKLTNKKGSPIEYMTTIPAMHAKKYEKKPFTYLPRRPVVAAAAINPNRKPKVGEKI